MKKIGFVDYYISEWHANNYPQWIEEMNEKLGLDYKVCYAWAEEYVSEVDGVNTDQWCEKMGIERCQTVEELCQKSDVIVVLAPSNPETHLRLAQAVLPYGKRTYIDKTFAPNLEVAKQIFELGEKYNAPFFSSSALRYGAEMAVFKDANNVMVTGGGRSLEEYGIHIIEMGVSILKDAAKQVKVDHVGQHRICNVVTKNGKKAALIYAPGMPYRVAAELPDGTYEGQQIGGDFFKNLIADMLNFFETGKVSFDPAETLEVMRLRDAILKADATENQWLDV